MAAISQATAPKLDGKTTGRGVVFSRREHLRCPFRFDSCFSGRAIVDRCLSFSTTNSRRNRPEPCAVSRLNPSGASNSFDVVVVGAGIIGLTIARQFLLESDLSVAVVDAAVPCSGATGAGQGYIWRVHKTPGTDKWELAMRSRMLWETLAETINHQGMDPLKILGWKKTGSLLVGKTAGDVITLKKKVDQLSAAGLPAQFLPGNALQLEEPAVAIGPEGGAAFVADDYQLDATRTVVFIEKVNRTFASQGRYSEFYHEPVIGLLRSGSSWQIKGVQTSKNTLYSKKAVVIAAGCWSGSLMHQLIKDSDIHLTVPIKPRKGHLLVIENFNSFKLNHGLMEVGYVNHQAAALQSNVADITPLYDAQTSSISMTATMDASGNLVLGSSRQLVGFNTDLDESIINRIWARAGEFFPPLKNISIKDLSKSRDVRIGLRPYMPDGKPVIGPVSGMSNLYLAAGHEGEGLTLALGTAEMIADMVLGNPVKVHHAPFAVQGRC